MRDYPLRPDEVLANAQIARRILLESGHGLAHRIELCWSRLLVAGEDWLPAEELATYLDLGERFYGTRLLEAWDGREFARRLAATNVREASEIAARLLEFTARVTQAMEDVGSHAGQPA